MTNIFLSVLKTSVSVSAVIVIHILLTPFLNKHYAAKWKYRIWIALAVCLLIPFRGADGLYRIGRWMQEKQQNVSEVQSVPEDIWQAQAVVPGQVIVEIPAQMTAPIVLPSEKGNVSINLLDITAYIWLLGCVAVLVWYMTGLFYYKNRIRKKGYAVENADIVCQIAELKHELHIKRTVYMVEYAEAASPMIIGFFKPVLVLPETQYRPEEMFFILKHELIHLKRKDVFFKWVFAAAHAVHWFNPLIWLMQKEASIDMELSCDESVVQGTDYDVRKAYTETLLSSLRRRCAKQTLLSTQFYAGKKIMKKRFKNILNQKEKKNGAAVLICAISLTLAFGILTGCSDIRESSENISVRKETEDPVWLETEDSEYDEDGAANSVPLSLDDEHDDADIPQNGQFYGYITGYDSDSVTVDRQQWITVGSMEWKPEYNEDAGFEVVDVEGDNITYSFGEDGTFFVLENHQGPVIELSKAEFEAYLQEMEYPVLWSMEAEEGRIKSVTEQYRP